MPTTKAMTDDLDQKTDAELNEIFAVEVAGRSRNNAVEYTINYCADAHAVLPWLDQHEQPHATKRDGKWMVFLWDLRDTPRATADTFMRAAVLALIRSRRHLGALLATAAESPPAPQPSPQRA